MRGRKPRPTYLKLVKGTRKSRINQNEAAVALRIPAPPPELNDDAKVEWGRASQELYQAGLLSNVDRAAFTCYCQAYGIWAEGSRAIEELKRKAGPLAGLLQRTEKGNLIPHPLLGIVNKARADMMRYAIEFGMTPSARSRVTARPPSEKEQDPAAAYFD